MATTLTEQRRQEIISRYGSNVPKDGVYVLPDSPNTALGPKGDIIDVSSGQIMGNISRYTGTDAVPTGETPTSFVGEMFKPGGAMGELKPYTPEEQATVREKERARVQAQIDAINELASFELGRAREAGAQRAGAGRALSAATGVLGAPIGEASAEEIRRKNMAEERAIEAAKAAKIGDILSGVESRSQDIIDKQKTLATTNAKAYVEYLTGVSTQALKDVEILAKGQIELSPSKRQQLIQQTGYDPETFDNLYKSVKIANAPQDVYINKEKPEIVGNKAVYFKQVRDPKTGKTSLVTETIDLPAGTNKKVKTTVNTAEGVQILYEDGTWEKIGGLPPTAKERDAALADKTTVTSQISTAKKALANAKGLAKAAGRGRTWIEAKKQQLIGATEYTNLESYANTLRTNILALATDPGVKKFFGPQMTNRDVELMTSAGTSLNPELQGPEQFRKELANLEALLNKLEQSAVKGGAGTETQDVTQNADEENRLRSLGYTDEQIAQIKAAQ